MRGEDGAWRVKTPVSNVAIVGGTHGNERNGVHMVRHYIKNPDIVRRDSFATKVLLANEEAVERIGTGAGTRYVQEDLNRCFSNHRLGGGGANDTSEIKCAQRLDALLGPKSSDTPSTDFIFDLHNTTANTGVLLCYHGLDVFTADLCGHLQANDPQIRLLQWPTGVDLGLLPTVARGGMTVEVGPLAHSTVDSRLLHQTMALISKSLDYIEGRNNGSIQGGQRGEATVFASRAAVDYPRGDDGEISAFIHEDLQGISELASGSILREGDPIFRTMSGSVIKFSRNDHAPSMPEGVELYPVFVNEAAYYEQGKAFILCTRAA